MGESKVRYPSCGALIEIKEALEKKFESELKADYEKKVVEKLKKMKSEAA